MHETKPVVIELDGPQEFRVQYRAYFGVLFLNPDTAVPGRVLLADRTGHCGSMLLEPDPVRAAELTERERFRRIIDDVFLVRIGSVLGPLYTRLCDAIDTPDEPDETASEYERGWAFGVGECRGLVRALRDRVANTTSRHCGLPDLNQLANGMDALLLSDKEPPR
jgi:hypothetical protein